jgi:two-component system chemotaxis sensor kinase CheA
VNLVERARQTFFGECRDLLLEMEEAIALLAINPGDRPALDAVFRAAHTIKGSGGLFELDHLVGFTHQLEGVLDHAREGRLDLDAGATSLLLQCRDHLETLVDRAVAGVEPDGASIDQGHVLLARLSDLLDDACAAAMEALPLSPSPGVETQRWEEDAETWHISVRFGADLFRKGLSPVPVLRWLGTLGRLTHVTTLAEAMPPAASMDPEACYLGLEIRLHSQAGKEEIEQAFEFVREDCELRMLPPGSRIEDYLRLIDERPEDPRRLGEILVACGAITARELAAMLELQAAEDSGTVARPPLGELAVRSGMAPPEVVEAALSRQQEARQQRTSENQLIRVQSEKLDRLIDRVGELVVASAGVGQSAAMIGEGGLLEAASAMARLVEDIREDAMRLRMVEIGETFSRFRRVVREISRQLDKDIELSIAGASTELDKNLVEQIAEPLTHLVRNAIDHGIEPAAERRVRGKPERGSIHLSARHEAGSVVIEIHDDGRGLDRDRILARAIQRGLVAEGETLTDAEAWNLIFAPGFSTAERVTDLSGRGVGMDVVKRSIEALHGSIEIESDAGTGTTFRIRLPLTLAIIGGFLMGVAGTHYVAPLDTVVECVELAPGAGAAGYLDLRGEVLPLLHLRRHFGLGGEPGRRQSVVVVSSQGTRAGLVVDRLEGELQAVIKPMGELFARLVGISGTTILGSGAVALLLDVPSLLASVGSGRHDAAVRTH